MVDPQILSELREKRKALLEQLDTSLCANDFSAFQKDLAAEIIRTERLKISARRDKDLQFTLKQHLHLCRHLGDGLAWRLLSPHAIRQFAKNAGGKVFLSNQLSATNELLKLVDWVAKESNRCAIMSDLTNLLRIGDVIVPDGSEAGIVFESKAGHKATEKGGYANRAARQRLRMERMAEYLSEDRGRVFATDEEICAISVQHSHEYIYEQVDAACLDALEKGFCAYQVGDHDVLLCLRSDQDLAAWLDQTTMPPFRLAVFGFHSRFMLEEVHPVFRPTPVWPVSLQTRQALLNREVMLTHIVDPLALVGFAESGWLVNDFNQKTCHYSVTNGNESLVLAEVWLDRWLYGFETASSVASVMIKFMAASMEYIKTRPRR